MPGRSQRVVFGPGGLGGCAGFPGDDFGMDFSFGNFTSGKMNFGGMGLGSLHGRHQRRGSAARASADAGEKMPAYAVPKDTKVTVRGLTGAPEYNGKNGAVVGW